MDYQNTIEKAGEYVKAYMRDHGNSNLLFHNLAHTESMVTAADRVARHSHLSHREHLITLVAAWFVDIGYYVDVQNPKQAGAELAEGFLKTAGIEPETIREVKQCILTSDLPHQPGSLPEQVVSDAYFFYLGADNFAAQNRLLRKETEAVHGISIGKEEWCHRSVALLESHHYHTDYCRQLLNRKKKQNLEKLKKKVKQHPELPRALNSWLEENLPRQQPDMVETGELRAEKGTETLFRITSGVSQRLSEQADNKANILISVNSIMMSILLSIVVARLERYPHLTLPIILFLGVNLVTITFSILATRPSVPSGVFDRNDIASRKVNLLFFGNFYRMNFDDYSTGMYKVLGDKNYLYFSFIKNLYEHGVVLGRKYRKLKVAYNIFMYGIIVSVLAFVVASQYFAPE